MLLKKIHVKNYRCFGGEPTVIEFSGSGLTALIGPNNVGKSTVLKMLEILLGDKWPTSQFSEDDFHNNSLKEEIVMACEFDEKIPVEISEQDRNIIGVAVRVKHLSTGYGESSMDVEYRLLESSAGLDGLDFDKLNIAAYDRSPRRAYINQEIRNQLPIVVTIPLIKLHSEQPTNKWGVLGRMLQKVETVFSANKEKEAEFREKMRDAVGVLRSPGEFKEIEKDVKEFWEEMKPSNLTGTTLEFLDYEPWRYYRQFKLAVKRRGKEVPVETLGEGVQRLAIIALYRSYLKRHGRNQKAILLIEEPESYLHPQARRTLFNVVKDAVKNEKKVEGQIIYTTHSEDFIACGDFDDIVIFSETGDSVSVRHISEEKLKDHTAALDFVSGSISDQRIHYNLIEVVAQGLKEALFASRAVIVEGPSEGELLHFFSQVDEDQTAVVIADGKSNIPAIYGFLTAFGIPCLVIADRDEEKPGENRNIVAMLTQPKAVKSDNTKLAITEAEINSVKDGEVFAKGRLLIFGKHLEMVLENKILDFADINTRLRAVFKIPRNSKPRHIHALGLAYHGTSLGGDKELLAKLKKAKPQVIALRGNLNTFIRQGLEKPELLSNVPEKGETDIEIQF